MCVCVYRERERERERERVFTFLCEQNMDWMEEKKIYSKKLKRERKRVKIKERWNDGKIVRLTYRVAGR